MKRTTEQLLTWGSLGIGLGLMFSRHKRLGLAIAAISPLTVVTQHPRGTRKALRLVPKAVAKAGEEVARGAKQAGKSMGWLAS